MEVFATFWLIVLVGLAIPITLLFAALLFDLVVVFYALIAGIWRLKRPPRTFGAVA